MILIAIECGLVREYNVLLDILNIVEAALEGYFDKPPDGREATDFVDVKKMF